LAKAAHQAATSFLAASIKFNFFIQKLKPMLCHFKNAELSHEEVERRPYDRVVLIHRAAQPKSFTFGGVPASYCGLNFFVIGLAQA
jgi:hypothetical protein